MEKEMNITEKLAAIQQEMVAPKNNKNTFGNYAYRTFESINEALKPLLKKYECAVILKDEVFAVEGTIFNKTTARLTDKSGEWWEVTSSCPFDLTHRGMSAEQCGGSTLSYSRKYCLQALLLLDGNADPDAMKPLSLAEQVTNCTSYKQLCQLWAALSPDEGTNEEIKQLFAKRKEQLLKKQ